LQQIVPAIACRYLFLGPGLLGHFEKEDIGQLGNILMIGNAVVPQDITETPKFLNNFLGVHA
jgi:FtsH-binding integral membrane protein